MANGEAPVDTTIKLKPVASNITGAVSDIVEVEEASNVEVSHTCESSLVQTSVV